MNDSPLKQHEVLLIGLDVFGRPAGDAFLLLRRQVGFQVIGNIRRDLRLHIKQLAELAVERLRPDVLVLPRIDQLHHDSHLVARSLHRPLQHVGHVEFAGDLRRGGPVVALIGHDRGSTDHLHVPNLGQRRGDHLSETVRKVFLRGALRKVIERQHRDGLGRNRAQIHRFSRLQKNERQNAQHQHEKNGRNRQNRFLPRSRPSDLHLAVAHPHRQPVIGHAKHFKLDVDPLELGKADALRAEIGVVRDVPLHLVGDRDAALRRNRLHPRRNVHTAAEHIVFRLDHVSLMDADAQHQPFHPAHLPLNPHSTTHGII